MVLNADYERSGSANRETPETVNFGKEAGGCYASSVSDIASFCFFSVFFIMLAFRLRKDIKK